jgi:hypothetical protein
MINKTDIPGHHPKVAFRNIQEQIVIVQPLEENILTLNVTGSFIWQQIGNLTVEQIAAKVSEHFEVSDSEALADTVEFLETMAAKGLVVTGDSLETSGNGASG